MAIKQQTPKLLTVPQATRQARAKVDRIMPGVMATVESRLSHDLASDTPIVVTTVTFPEGIAGRHTLYAALSTLPGYQSRTNGPTYFTVTRTR